MIQAARKAARRLVRDFGEVENLTVSIKGAGDFVSIADRKAEETIREALMEARPNYGWVGEESEPVAGADPTRRWIVDPLDGTTNFLNGVPHWAISIALEHKGDIVAGVIYDPIKDEIFVAETGAGAWMNDRRLRVKNRREPSSMLFGTGFPAGGKGDLTDMMQSMTRLMGLSATIRRQGAAALDLAYVAAGRYDGFWHHSLSSWDFAAGMVIVREAGGLVGSIRETTVHTNPLPTGDIVVGHADAYSLLQKVLAQGS